MRAIRARFVADLVQSHAMVFGILDTAFLIKEERRELPAVKELIADDTFLYKPGTDELNGLLRHPSLKKVYPHLSYHECHNNLITVYRHYSFSYGDLRL